MRRLVLDANILIRAVLGSRVRGVITTYAADVEFFVPSIAYDEAERHLPEILTKHDRADQVEAALDYVTQLRDTVLPLPEEVYLEQRPEALARIEQRDPDDWPILAAAMVLDCPIWTEDNDFFGTGVPTWTNRPSRDLPQARNLSDFRSGQSYEWVPSPTCGEMTYILDV